MGFKSKPVVGCFCILSLVLILLFLDLVPRPYSRPCKCYTIDQPLLWDNAAYSLRLDTLDTYTIVTESGLKEDVPKSTLMDMRDTRVMLHIPQPVAISGYFDTGKERLFVGEASFAVSFTMSLDQPSWNQTIKENARGLAFVLVPGWSEGDHGASANITLTELLGLGKGGSLKVSKPINGTAPLPGGGNVSVSIGRLHGESVLMDVTHSSLLVAHITTMEPANVVDTYTVWIDYDSYQHWFSVYVDAGEGKRKPDKAVAVRKKVSYRDASFQVAHFGLFSSAGQLMKVHTWNTNVEDLSGVLSIYSYKYVRRRVIQFSVVGSVPAAILMATAVACYFRSKQRRWKKEQDKLAKIMQRLPGVPTQVDFADIRNATGNFHETMKLGKGGFSSVYRCRLPVTGSRKTSTVAAMEVAVKKFTREVEERRFEDFLAEVSIINRLRHKNIVPLVGWSYSRGEPLLIYEYMANGSLDQHLFRKVIINGELEQQQEDTSIRQWHTRYCIVMDIATGLHYVHHEHEPTVLHRDIKASNIMLDSTFRARLGDFGIACTVAEDRSSVTGVAGTWGYIAPEYAMNHRATRLTDIYAFGVLILEVVTGKKNRDVPPDDGHISDWVWRLHGEGKLLETLDHEIISGSGDQQLEADDEVIRLLLLGLACTNPNPSNRPSMAQALQVINKLAPPPDVPPERPPFVWPPVEWRSHDSDYSTTVSNLVGSSASTVELVRISLEQPPPEIQSATFVRA